MDCIRAQTLLAPEPGPSATSPEVEEAFAHYSACGTCQTFFANQRRVANRLRHIARHQSAPDVLRNRIVAAINLERDRVERRRSHVRLAFAGGGALVAAAAAVVVLLSTPASPLEVVSPFVAQATEQEPAPQALTTADAVPLERWLASQLGESVHVPIIPDAQLVSGGVTSFEGMTSAAVRYRVQGTDLTYFALPAGKTITSMAVADDEMISLTSGDYEVVVWGEGGSARVLVAHLPRDELQAIAVHCRMKRITLQYPLTDPAVTS
jgi:anti-sigma factor RsiW